MYEDNLKSKPILSPLEIAIILGFLALLAFIAIPNFLRPHTTSSNACINNLRQIDAAKQQWALENNKTNLNTVVTWSDVKLYLGRGTNDSLSFIYCREDKTKNASNSYTLGDLKSPPKCKINPAAHFIN
jgi:hypothetical protein